MKSNHQLRRRILSVTAGLALAGSSVVSLRAATTSITNNFNASGDMAGWGVNYGNGTVGWNSTAGTDGSGCLMFTIDASNPATDKIGPLANPLPTPINSADYVSVEYDLMIDPASGFDAGGVSYGNLQEVLRDANWSWDSHWVGALGSGYNGWTHMKFDIPNNAKTYPRFGFELGGAAPYSGSVTGYLDNLVFNAFINPLVASSFATVEDTSTWFGGQLATLSFATQDAGGSGSSGSLQLDVAYDSSNAGWQEGIATHPISFSPPRYTYVAFDLYVENPNALSGLGILQLFLNTGGWTMVGAVNVNAGMVGQWTHVEMPLPSTPASASGLIFQVGGGMTAPVVYRLDNVRFYKPITAPALGIKKAGAAGVQITMNDNGNQWQRDAICSPQGSANSMWNTGLTNQVAYSFTIAEFPDPVKHEGFEAHLYIVNTDTAGGTFNETYGGCDWNAADIAIMSLQSLANGNYQCQFQWKTNLPNNNPPDDPVHRPGMLTSSTALGTWSLLFVDRTNITMSGPGGISTNFTIPEEAVLNNFTPAVSFVQYGFHKNDNENNGHNNGISGVFSRVTKVGGEFEFDDTFNGGSFTNNYAWRKSTPSAVVHVPIGTAWWVNWSLPADGYSVVSSASVTGPYSDASVTNTYQSGAVMYGAVPAAALPPGSATFFGLTRPQ